MSRSFPAVLAFAALVASPLAAQQARSQAPVPSVPSVVSGAPVFHRIMTLAWTEIRLPRSVANASSTSAQPVASTRSQIFTLTWQDAGRRDSTPVIAAASSPSCQVTVLMTVPCSAQ